MAIPVGSKAPDFSLKSKTASGLVDVKLGDNLGSKNTVLLFFPLAFTSVCTQEMCDITSGLNAYSGLGADVIGVSVDSPFSQEAWAQKEKIGIKLASDLNKKTAQAYGVLLDDLIGLGSVSARAAFVIDRKGVVRYSEQTPTPKELPNFSAIKEALEKIK
jgi:peroxiredoxin